MITVFLNLVFFSCTPTSDIDNEMQTTECCDEEEEENPPPPVEGNTSN